MKIICIGRNYTEHIKELNNQKDAQPVVFMKPDTALIGKDQPFVIPEFSENVQHEAEIVVKISKVGKYIAPKFAHKYYEQITIGIDFTARDLQEKLKEKGLPWEISKAFDGSASVGQFIDKSSIENLNGFEFSLEKNDEIVQKGNTQQMLHSIDELIAYVSQYFTLKTGDLIFTGTPAGVSKIESGDVLTGYIENQELLKLQVL